MNLLHRKICQVICASGQLADLAESAMAAETIVVPSKVESLVQSFGSAWSDRRFARTPTPAVQNAAWLAPTPLSRIFDKRILEKIIAVTSGVVVVTRKTSLP